MFLQNNLGFSGFVYCNNFLLIMNMYAHKIHRKLKLSIGDIYLDNRKINNQPVKPPEKTRGSDAFLSFKQSYQLPSFKSRQKYNTLDAKKRLGSLQVRPNRYKLQSKLRSKTILADDIEKNYIRKQLCSIEVGQLNDSTLQNPLDNKFLTQMQRLQIKKYKDVFYIGHKAHLRKHKDCFRDKQDNYKAIIGDHIAYRFQIIKILGSGAFGKVLQVKDHKHMKNYALKILKSSPQLYQQFKLQIQILQLAKKHPSTNKNIVQLKGDFQFRGHICIITQMLSMNVYSYIKSQNYQGFQVNICRKILIQLMQALLFLHHKGIIHCDIKPQNVVFKELGKSGVKLIDFGSACFQDRKEFTYIQSRYYRSPEIVLMKPYDNKIDVWSLGCLIYQIYTGTPLFPSRTQEQQMKMLVTTLGAPPQHFLAKCERRKQFDFSQFEGHEPQFPLKDRLKECPPSMLRLMERMVRWSPEERPTIYECLMDDFVLEALPRQVRQEHIKQMKSNNPYNLYQ